MRGARCTSSVACESCSKHTRSSPWVHRTDPAFPHAMVLTVSFVISSVIGLFVTVICVSKHRLDASVEASGPHDFAVRLTCCSSKAPSASTASRPAFVTIAIRPLSGTRRRGYNFDLGETTKGIFLQMGLDSPNHIESFQQMTLRAHPKTLQISVSMRSLFSRWRDNRSPSGASARYRSAKPVGDLT